VQRRKQGLLLSFDMTAVVTLTLTLIQQCDGGY
jgi:hypothetical protein